MLDKVVCGDRVLADAPLRGVPRDFLVPESHPCKSRMIAYFCHDFRLPLSAILANAEFLRRSGLSEMERAELYLEIREAIDRMNEMLSSLSEYSK